MCGYDFGTMAADLHLGRREKPTIMGNTIKIAILAGAMLAIVPTAWTQSPKGLTARELFFSTPAPTAAKPETPKPKPAKPQQQAAKAKPARPAQPHSSGEAVPVTLASNNGDAQFLNVAATSNIPLGLRYSILKYAGDDDFVEVDPDLVFRSGDRIRLRVQVNDSGYLYIVTQGSSGNWRVLFPNTEYDSGNNHVVRGRSYDIPGRTRFVFNEQPGTEKVFLVLSRKPEADLDKLIYELDNPAASQPTSQPVEAPRKPEPIKTMMAMSKISIDDSLVGKIRSNLIARDLVFEKVNDDKPASSNREKEKAVYVVNPDRGAESRLVVDIALKHR